MLNLLAATTAASEDIVGNSLPETVDISKLDEFLQTLGENLLAYLPTLILAIIVLILGVILAKILLKVISKGMAKSKADVTATGFVHSLVKISLYIVVFSIVLTILGIPATSIFAVIGTAGVAIGLALQNSLSHIAGGFIIIFNKPFKVGDYIESSTVSGVVKRIDIYYTVVTTIDNKVIYVPNGSLSDATVVNFSANDLRIVEYKFSISYDSDYDKAVDLIKQVINENKLILNDKEPLVRMCDHAESAITILTRVWTKAENYWEVYYSLLEEVYKTFGNAGINIPFNQLDVHLTK